MSRRCELTAKGPQVGHKVSHSNIKTKRRFLPNLCNVTLISDALGRSVRLRISTNALKSIDHRGGLDAFLMKARDEELAPPVAGAQAPDQEEAHRGGGGLTAKITQDLCAHAGASGQLDSSDLQQVPRIRGTSGLTIAAHGSAKVNCSSSVR